MYNFGELRFGTFFLTIVLIINFTNTSLEFCTFMTLHIVVRYFPSWEEVDISCIQMDLHSLILIAISCLLKQSTSTQMLAGYRASQDVSSAQFTAEQVHQRTVRDFMHCGIVCNHYSDCNAYNFDKDSKSCSLVALSRLERVPPGNSMVSYNKGHMVNWI